MSLLPISILAQSVDIQGHRGCRGLLPENTLPAFQKALDIGVQTLELDVVISKDNQVVISHEPHFNPVFTTKPDGTRYQTMTESNLFHMDYEQIRKHDVGKLPHPDFSEQQPIPTYKPLLRDLLRMLKDHNSVRLNIELKSLPNEYSITQPHPEVFCSLVIEEIKTHFDFNRTCFQSFDFKVLQILNAKNKFGYKIAVLIESKNNSIFQNLRKLGFTPDIWSPYFKILNQKNIKSLHSKGIMVIPWTVNEPKDMLKMVRWGCDGIITDYPNRALNLNFNQIANFK